MNSVIAVPTHLKLALSIPEAAEMVSLSEASLRRLVNEGVLARVPHTERVLIARAELDRYVTSTMVAA